MFPKSARCWCWPECTGRSGLAAGEPEMRMVYFPREGCEIIDTWNVMGMRGTCSHDISVTDVYVPKFRTFPMEPDFPA